MTNTTTPPTFSTPDLALPREALDTLIVEIAATVDRLSLARRDALLSEVASIEAEHGYGTHDKPSTAQLRKLWKATGGYCPECGKRLKI